MESDYNVPVNIEIDGKKYTVQPQQEIDQVFYNITMNGKLMCTIGINDEGVWEADCSIDVEFVQKIGNKIEQMEV